MAVFVLVYGSSFKSRTTTNGKSCCSSPRGACNQKAVKMAFGINFCVVSMVFAIVRQLCNLALFCMDAIAILVLKQHST
jgi:hypothetical protein